MSSNPENYFGFTFDEFTELDCRAFSLFQTVPGCWAFSHSASYDSKESKVIFCHLIRHICNTQYFVVAASLFILFFRLFDAFNTELILVNACKCATFVTDM